jgi:RNA polymerase sigma-70 factor (ECF subfamily)
MIYCVVPYALAPKLHDQLRAHFAGDALVEVIVERRGTDRRVADERRQAAVPAADERRRVRNLGGRRVGSRRAPTLSIDAPPLPRRARAHAGRLVFVERAEPTAEHLADLDSSRLVTRFQSGDENAFTELYMRYFDRIYSYLRVLFREDPHEAEDLTQQVFVRAFEALPRYERRSQPFRAWLFRIARNLAMTRLRQRERSDLVEPAVLVERREAEPAEETLSTLSWLTDRELVMFVERLPLPQRQVLALRYMLDLPTKEIATMLGRSADDVRMLEHRAVRFLEGRLNAIGRGSADDRQRPQPVYGRTRWMPVLRRRGGALYRNAGRVGIR